jgi:hypothetical protein
LTTLSLAALRFRAGQQRDAHFLAYPVLDLDRQVDVLAQELARVVLALADLLAVVGIPEPPSPAPGPIMSMISPSRLMPSP